MVIRQQKKRKKKKPKKKHYKTGIHNSEKCLNNPIKYRSGWEYTVCKFLDVDPEVKHYSYEPIKISYMSNMKTKKMRNYIPDFLVTYINDSKKLIEVKRKSQINNRTVIKKTLAAKEWCEKENIKFEFVSEDTIKKYEKFLKE